MAQIALEIPIIALSLCLWPVRLKQTYMQYIHNTKPVPSMLFFILQVILSVLWAILSTYTGQWLMLLTISNSLLCQLTVIYYSYALLKRKIEMEKEPLLHESIDAQHEHSRVNAAHVACSDCMLQHS